jgi:hypothetical protein
MPDVYQKGASHRPWTTVTGHYLGMQPVGPLLDAKPDSVWYRGDDYLALVKDFTEMTTRCAALAGIVAQSETHIEELKKQIASSTTTWSKRLAELEAQIHRRPPKRAQEKEHG